MSLTISNHVDNTAHCPREHLVECPPPPRSAKIELVRTCNFRCAFCYHSRLSQTVGHMNWQLYTKIVDELRFIGVAEVAPFFYGESFLSPKLADAVCYAADRGFERVFLTTNGSVATADRVKACMQAGLHSLKFSLNYADADQLAERACVSPAVFNVIKRNVKEARAVRDAGKFQCGLFASYIRYDDKQDERMRPLLDEMRPYLDEIYALPMYGVPSRIKQQTFVGGNPGRADNPVPPLPCWALFREAHVNYDGIVYACSFNTGDRFSMGDLNKQSFMEIWHGDRFRALRRAHLALDVRGTPCEDCVTKKNG